LLSRKLPEIHRHFIAHPRENPLKTSPPPTRETACTPSFPPGIREKTPAFKQFAFSPESTCKTCAIHHSVGAFFKLFDLKNKQNKRIFLHYYISIITLFK
jgi:hypothetical protein